MSVRHQFFREICFRGAGVLFPFYLGICAVMKRLGRRFEILRGMSSGALVATFVACDLPLEKLLIRFQRFLWWYKTSHGSDSHWKRVLKAVVLDLKYRHQILPRVMRALISDDQARACSGRLSVVAFSLTDLRVIENNQWRDTQHLIDWVLASMAIPCTSLPRHVDGHWLMDPYHFDCFWPLNRGGQARSCLYASPLERYPWILLRPPAPWTFSMLDSLTCSTAQMMYTLYRLGLYTALSSWALFL